MRWLLVFSCVLVGCDASAAPLPGGKPAGDWRGDVCHGDDGCRWNDPCRPTSCVAARGDGAPAACEKASSTPGTCGCVEEMCTLRPPDLGIRRTELRTGRARRTTSAPSMSPPARATPEARR